MRPTNAAYSLLIEFAQLEASGAKPATAETSTARERTLTAVSRTTGRVEFHGAGDQGFRFGLADRESDSAATRRVSGTMGSLCGRGWCRYRLDCRTPGAPGTGGASPIAFCGLDRSPIHVGGRSVAG
jgi:hypothetical protein